MKKRILLAVALVLLIGLGLRLAFTPPSTGGWSSGPEPTASAQVTAAQPVPTPVVVVTPSPPPADKPPMPASVTGLSRLAGVQMALTAISRMPGVDLELSTSRGVAALLRKHSPNALPAEGLVDHWGSELIVDRAGANSFRLFSLGPDRKAGTDDDVILQPDGTALSNAERVARHPRGPDAVRQDRSW
jgi:hypothetical protein